MAELNAICYWDRDYYRRDSHDFIDISAWQARQQKFTEILEELEILGLGGLIYVKQHQDRESLGLEADN